MSLLIGKPHTQYCPKCGWVNPIEITTDVLFLSHCPKCEYELALRKRTTLDQIKQKINSIKFFQ